MESPCPQLPVYLEGRVPPGLRAVGKQSGEASRSSPVGDSEQVRQDSVLHQGQMGGAQRGPPFQDASLCLPRRGSFMLQPLGVPDPSDTGRQPFSQPPYSL